jgi:exopolyphosphatase/guanosine-5'-triphosphate,3'-diphosphate pyrophosphatase
MSDQILAAVDLGSNSFHIIVVRLDHGQVRVIDRMREMVRLGAGLDENNNLDEAACQRAIQCLERFGQRLRDLHPNNVRIVGTNTLRKARNSSSLLRQAQQALGHPIDIISGIEEARLIYLGVSHSMSDDEGRKLVVDIGGGSTELIIGERFESLQLESLYMGCVSMSRTFFPDGAITKSAMKSAEIAARLELEGAAPLYKKLGWEHSIGASGTARAIAKVVEEEGWSEHGITYKSLKKLRKALLAAGHVDKLSLKGLSEDRIPVFTGGVVVMLSVFEALGIKTMEVSSGALREGLVYDMLGQIEHKDIREQTVNALCARYHVDMRHAERVEVTAIQLLEQVAGRWQLEDEENWNLLGWAARLHEVGLDIAHGQYQKHGAYLAENSDMHGFSRRLQKQLAVLIRGHRRKFPVASIEELTTDQQENIKYLCILLRLSVKLNHSRNDAHIPEVKIEVVDDGLKVNFPQGWLEDHPLTAADLEREQQYLGVVKFKLKYS